MSKEMTGYPSIDKPWLKYYSEEAIHAKIPSCTVYENIYGRNSNRINNTALIYYGKKISYGELFENTEKVKRAFENAGVKKGDIVVMITSSTPETVYSILALCRIGAVANMLNPFFGEQQMIDRIKETNACILIALDRLYKNISAFADKLPIRMTIIIPVTNSMPVAAKLAAKVKLVKTYISYNDRTIIWNDFIKSSENAEPTADAEYEKGRPFVMVYSSGTTGASKGIVLTNDGINSTICHYLNLDLPISVSFTFLQMIPLWFSTGIVLSLFMPLTMQMTTILEPVFNEKVFVDDMLKYKPNSTLVATSIWIYLMKSGQYKRNDMSFMKFPVTGGEKLLPETEMELNSFIQDLGCKTNLLKGYGMCELGSTVTGDLPTVFRTGSVGIPLENIVVSAFDIKTNRELKYGERGEIRVLTPARMREYYNNPDETSRFFYTDDNGNSWGRTGDIGFIDEDGFVFILGRASDIFIANSGKTIYCFDIENVILQHQAVNQCKVVGVEKEGRQLLIAHIVLNDNTAQKIDQLLKEINELCKNELYSDSVPWGYVIRDAMPIKNSGKLDIEKLKSANNNILLVDETIKQISF